MLAWPGLLLTIFGCTSARSSVGTVKNVVQRIIEKLGVSDRTQAAVLAVKAGLLVN